MFRNHNRQVRSGWLLLVAIIMLIIAQLLFSFPGLYLFDKISSNLTSTIEFEKKLSQYPWIELLVKGGSVFGSILMILLTWKILNRGSIKEIGLRFDKEGFKDLFIGLIFGAAAITMVFMTLLLTNQLSVDSTFTEPQFSIYTLTFLILFIGVGFSEEIFFRGYIMKTMEHRGNPKWVIYLVSAVVFALFHGLNPNVTFFGLINIGLAGLLFSFMYDLTKSLWMPIGYHITWNYFQGNVFGFPVSGTDPHGLYNVSIKVGSEWLTGGKFGPEAGVLDTVVTLLFLVITYVYVKRKKITAI